jgi:hypothetical protein
VEVIVRFRYISIKGDWERSKAEAAFLNRHDVDGHALASDVIGSNLTHLHLQEGQIG